MRNTFRSDISRPNFRSLLLLLPIFLLTVPVLAPAKDEALFYPLIRYAIPDDAEPTTEYIGTADGPYADQFANFPAADGPMVLDCQAVEEIGLVIKPLGIGGWHYGAKRKYRFEWAHSSPDIKNKKSMQYKKNTPQGYMRNRLKLKKWKADGTVDVTITVGDEVIYTDRFLLENCAE